MWLLCNQLDFDTASKLPQVLPFSSFLVLTEKKCRYRIRTSRFDQAYRFPFLEMERVWKDGWNEEHRWIKKIHNHNSSYVLSSSDSWRRTNLLKRMFFSRDVEIESLEKNFENQPKFFANSMKVTPAPTPFNRVFLSNWSLKSFFDAIAPFLHYPSVQNVTEECFSC